MLRSETIQLRRHAESPDEELNVAGCKPDVTVSDEANNTAEDEETSVSARQVRPGARAARNTWHIAADWVEAFSPVIYEPISSTPTGNALAERVRLDARIAYGEPRRG